MGDNSGKCGIIVKKESYFLITGTFDNILVSFNNLYISLIFSIFLKGSFGSILSTNRIPSK